MTAVRATVVVTGDEVLGGRVTETNAAFIARDLAAHGIHLERTIILGDDADSVAATVADHVSLGGLICITGGLGPTADDRTMQAVAQATGRDLYLDPTALERVRERSRGVRRQMHIDDRELDAMRKKQANLPVGADMLEPVGTAPGCVVVQGSAVIVVLPGPPSEAQPMWVAARAHPAVRSIIESVAADPRAVLRTWGVVEAELMVALRTLPAPVIDRLGTYTRAGEIEVVTTPDDRATVRRAIEDHFPGAIFTDTGRDVDEVVAQSLLDRGERLSVAESCTGGGLGRLLTERPGASDWFDGGVISYSDDVKTRLLGVQPGLLAEHGAVSIECARQMAIGVREATGSTWGVSITGIAGPGGGTADKPVGTVCIAVSGPVSLAVSTRSWSRDRAAIRNRSHIAALHLLRQALETASAESGS